MILSCFSCFDPGIITTITALYAPDEEFINLSITLVVTVRVHVPCAAHVTRILLGAREDIKYSPRAIILLIGLQIVDMRKLDEHLAKVHVR